MKVCTVCRARFRTDPPRCPLDGGALVDVPDPLIGRAIAGRYVITEKIGSGGMGTVYRATQEVVGRHVAIKFLSPELAIDPTSRERFLREARAANRINHEHIIDITDFGDTGDGLVYLVMEFLTGVPLNEEIAKGPMTARRALAITLQIAQALARAHELDVIHRDIKPENIYLLEGYDGDFVKILDFGLAQMKGELKLTATGTVFGTPEYMAPEQARGAPATLAVDLYAVGCVLFEMLTTHLPFSGNTPDLILKHIRERPRPPSALRPDVPPRVDALVLQLLEKKPDARHPGAYALADEVKQILGELGAPRESLPPRSMLGKTSILPGRFPSPPKLSGIVPTEPEADLIHTQSMVTEQMWEERLALFQKLAKELHPRGDGPPWLLARLEELAGRLSRLKDARAKLDSLAGVASKTEGEMRDARMRIGKALDVLGRDESRVLRQLADIKPRLEEAQARLVELEKPLLRAWASIPPMPADRPRASREIADLLREGGQLAAIWLEAERALAEQQRDHAERDQEREDLRFQIAQLKGRMGTLNAESDIDLGGMRDQTQRLDEEIRGLLDELARDVEPVHRHFAAIPAVRDRVFAAG